ncbi:hypothetical protein BGX20_009646 [Mortierella sp. AD010]|nr:hypothetical protein BGX20_009646 [Mortierella sp. AD010]
MDKEGRVNVLSFSNVDDEDLLDDDWLLTHNSNNRPTTITSQRNLLSPRREPEESQNPTNGIHTHNQGNDGDLRNDITNIGTTGHIRDDSHKDLRKDIIRLSYNSEHTSSTRDLRREIECISNSRSQTYAETTRTPSYKHDLRSDILALTRSTGENTSLSNSGIVSQQHEADRSQDRHSTIEAADRHDSMRTPLPSVTSQWVVSFKTSTTFAQSYKKEIQKQIKRALAE